jgi:effector-binding domain-containing protein
MIDTSEIIDLPEQKMAVIALNVPSNEIMTHMGPGIGELHAVLAAQGVKPTGPWFTHHHRAPTDTFDFEICLPVDTDVQPSGRVKPAKRPAMKAASTTYRGGYEGLGSGWHEFINQLKDRGLAATDELWETYEVGPESGPDTAQYRTLLRKPLK